jgi:glutathione S-transferase
MAGVHYEKPKCKKRPPKGKLPFIELNGKLIGDSDQIMKHLVENGLAKDLDVNLTPEKRALGYMIRQMVEEHLYFISVYSRWIDDEGWETFREELKNMFPIPIPFLRNMVMSLVRMRVKSMLKAQGIARHSREEIVEMGKEAIIALSDLLQEQKYFLSNDEPTTVDCTVFGALANVVFDPIDTELFSFCRSQPNITEYVRRMKACYWN